MTLFPCPCCGYRTLEEPASGTFDICPICYWEDDNVQLADPDRAGGANAVSLREAQRNFAEYGASELRFRSCVRRPAPGDVRDPAWVIAPDRIQRSD
jgi:hypothetical protein